MRKKLDTRFPAVISVRAILFLLSPFVIFRVV